MTDRDDDDLLTVNEILQHLDMKDRAFLELRRAGGFPPPVRIGNSARWRWQTIREWVKAVELIQSLTPKMVGGKNRQKPAKTGEDRQSSAGEGLPPSKPSKAR